MATKHDIFPLVLPILRWLRYPPHPHIHSFWLTSTQAQDGDEALKAFLDAQERHQDFVEASLEAVRSDATHKHTEEGELARYLAGLFR